MGAAKPAPGTDRVSGVARMAAALMRSEGGPEVAVIEASGLGYARQSGRRQRNAWRSSGWPGSDRALRTLADDLGPLWPQTAVLAVTEFGRTAAMNGTRGTDHGTGGCAFLAGGAVRGGRVIADWPGLSRTSLIDDRDLRPTLDLRSIFKAVLDEHLHVDGRTLSTRIFPDSSGARPAQRADTRLIPRRNSRTPTVPCSASSMSACLQPASRAVQASAPGSSVPRASWPRLWLWAWPSWAQPSWAQL